MINRLEDLINQGENVKRSCYHVSEYGSYLAGVEYETWISKCILFLNNYFTDNDLTVKFKNASISAVNNSIEYFDTMIGVLYAIRDMPYIGVSKESLCLNKTNKLFISHANLDKGYCDLLVDLIIDVGVKREDIFYSSFDETGVTLGEDLLDFIRDEFTCDRNVYVLFMLSNNFYESKVCLAEMGASWVSSFDYLPILIPPTSFEDIKGVIKPSKNSMKINDSSKLEALKEKLELMFNIENKISAQAWTRKKEEYLSKVNTFISKNKKDDLEVVLEKVIDFGGKKNSRLKLRLTNNCKRVIRPSEIDFEIKDDSGNVIKEIIDDERITEVVLSPFEKIIFYVDLFNINANFRKTRLVSSDVNSIYEYLS
jgi:hypothetical protein